MSMRASALFVVFLAFEVQIVDHLKAFWLDLDNWNGDECLVLRLTSRLATNKRVNTRERENNWTQKKGEHILNTKHILKVIFFAFYKQSKYFKNKEFSKVVPLPFSFLSDILGKASIKRKHLFSCSFP